MNDKLQESTDRRLPCQCFGSCCSADEAFRRCCRNVNSSIRRRRMPLREVCVSRVEDAIGEPQALMVVVDETAMRGTAVEASTDAGAVCHMVYHDRAVVFNQAHLGAMLEVSITVTNLVVTSHSVAGHEHRHHSDCCE